MVTELDFYKTINLKQSAIWEIGEIQFNWHDYLKKFEYLNVIYYWFKSILMLPNSCISIKRSLWRCCINLGSQDFPKQTKTYFQRIQELCKSINQRKRIQDITK